MSNEPGREYWQGEKLVERYLRDVREAVPDRGRQIEVMLRLFDSLKRPVKRFLDLGCGDGILSGALMEQYPKATGVLVDYSKPMLAAARKRFGDANPAVTLLEADLSKPNTLKAAAEAGPYDVVVSAFAIHHLRDIRKRELYGEVLGWLRPGGMFINHEHVASHSKWIERVWDDLMIDSIHRHRTNSGDKVDRQTVAEDYESREDAEANILALVELQCAWLRDLGYIDVDCYFKLFEIATFGGRKPLG